MSQGTTPGRISHESWQSPCQRHGRADRQGETYKNITSLETSKHAVFVDCECEDGATGQDAVADAAVTGGMGTASIIGGIRIPFLIIEIRDTP